MSYNVLGHITLIRQVLKDACRVCGAEKERNGQGKLQKCSPCNAIGRRILYCSKECQVKDYREGVSPLNSPHKLTCGKHVLPSPPGPSTNFLATSQVLPLHSDQESDGTSTLPHTRLFTSSPSTALQTQLEFLARKHHKAHYAFILPNGKCVPHRLKGKSGVIFAKMRKEALEQCNKSSIALMELILASSIPETPKYKDSYWVDQLEREYGVDMRECHREYEQSDRHFALFKEWSAWMRPKCKIDPRTGHQDVYFQRPLHYPDGRFHHPKDGRTFSTVQFFRVGTVSWNSDIRSTST